MTITENGTDIPEYGSGGLSRRSFIRFGSAAGLTVLLGGAAGTLSGCDLGDQIFRGTRTITDDAGREVKIPTASELERIYFTSSLAQIFCFTLNPDILAGTAIRFTKQELELLPEGTGDLSYLGSMSEDGEIDREALIVEKVQVVFSISGIGLTEQNISEAETLQDQTQIPVVLIDGSFSNIANAYRELGDIFGTKDRAEDIAVYLEGIYDEVTAAVDTVPDEDRITLYYAEGPLGLQTDPDVSQHSLTFKVGGANNVAAVEETQGLGMTNVSLEQVIAWNPAVIVAWDDVIRGGADERIRTNADWSKIKAVQDGRVYTMPNEPFSWCDRPPGVNRFIGIQWIANMLYPDIYDIDMVEATKEFYSRLYWVDIDDDKAKEILGNSYPPYGHAAASGTAESSGTAEQGGTAESSGTA